MTGLKGKLLAQDPFVQRMPLIEQHCERLGAILANVDADDVADFLCIG
jgi:hypothetical protein